MFQGPSCVRRALSRVQRMISKASKVGSLRSTHLWSRGIALQTPARVRAVRDCGDRPLAATVMRRLDVWQLDTYRVLSAATLLHSRWLSLPAACSGFCWVLGPSHHSRPEGFLILLVCCEVQGKAVLAVLLCRPPAGRMRIWSAAAGVSRPRDSLCWFWLLNSLCLGRSIRGQGLSRCVWMFERWPCAHSVAR